MNGVTLVVFDEITRLKVARGVRARALLDVIPRAARRVGLTGTPGTLLDLHGQYLAIDGGTRLGRYITHYRTKWFWNPDAKGWNWLPRQGADDAIKQAVAPITVVEHATALPFDPIFTDIDVVLPPELRAEYKKLQRDGLLAIDADTVLEAPNAATLVGKLTQYVGGACYDGTGGWKYIHAEKLKALAIELPDRPTIVFYAYQHERTRLMHGIEGAECLSDGTASEQADRLQRWNSGQIKALVAHPASCAHGLNLQHGGADVIWYSLTWSRDLYDQANARVARQGQTKQVVIKRLLVPSSIDWAVAHSLHTRGTTERELVATLRIISQSNTT
jgi:hypothetical protein